MVSAISSSTAAPRAAAASDATPPAVEGTLRLGSTGPSVTAAQKALNAAGEQLPVNGHFGPRMFEAVRRFQMAVNARGDGPLRVTGAIDASTLKALQGRSKPTPVASGWTPAAKAQTASSQATKPQAAAGVTAPTASAAKNADLRFDVFDNDKGWKQFYTGAHYGDRNAQDAPFSERVSQRMRLTKDDKIFCETKAVVKAPPEKILSQLTDPHFWANGSVDNWTKKPDGSFTYALWPAGKMTGLKVNETMHPPERQADGSYIVRIDLKRESDGRQIVPGQAEGLAYFLIKPRPDGSTEVSGRFAGVKSRSPVFGPQQFAENHLLAERGELKAGASPFNHFLPNGTGVGAMLRRAEEPGP